MSTLDEIVSSRGETAPETQQDTKPETQETPQGQQPPVEGDPPQDDVRADERGMVPQQALHAERQKAKRYTEQVASFESKLSSVEQALAARDRQISELLQRIPQQQQPPPPDFFENPNEAVLRTVAPHLQYVQQRQAVIVEELARTRYGDETVDEAAKAYEQLRQSGALDPADYHKIANSQNPFSAVVQWHKKRQASLEIGDDPAAYREKVKAEVLAEIQQGGQNGNGQQPAVMPSNFATARNVGSRTGPAWSGPKPLTDIFNRR